MSSGPFTYTAAELPADSISDMFQRLLSAGKTPEAVTQHGTDWYIQVADAISQADLKTDINAATLHTLSLDTSDISVAGDGVATGTIVVTDSRGASANGKTCEMVFPGPGGTVASPISVALAGVGQATFTFGPSPAADWCSGRVHAKFKLSDDSAMPASASVRFTG